MTHGRKNIKLSSVNNTITWMIHQKGFGSGRRLTEVVAFRDWENTQENSFSIADVPTNTRTKHLPNITAMTACLVPVQTYHMMKITMNKAIYNYSIIIEQWFLICLRKLVFTNRPTADVCEIAASCEEIRVKPQSRHTQEVLVNFRSKKTVR